MPDCSAALFSGFCGNRCEYEIASTDIFAPRRLYPGYPLPSIRMAMAMFAFAALGGGEVL